MNILNKLNGWQRLGLIAAVAGQLAVIVQWSVWSYPTVRNCIRWNDRETNDFAFYTKLHNCAEFSPYQNTLMRDLEDNGIVLAYCLAAYVTIYVAVIIVRWVISGFKK